MILFLEKCFLCFLQTSLNAGILMILLISVSAIFKNKISIRVKQWLWILFVIRLVVPVVPEMNFNLSKIIQKNYTETFTELNDQESVDVSAGDVGQDKNKKVFNNNYLKNGIEENISTDNINKNNNLISLTKIGTGIWICGAIFIGFVLMGAVYIFKFKSRKLKDDESIRIDELLSSAMAKTNINKKIPVYAHSRAESPCIIGIIKPKIYMPEYILKSGRDSEIFYILLHELMHYKKKDTLVNFLSAMGLCIHWFNPLVWVGVKRMKLNMEYACDSSVLETLEEKQCIDYGLTLINISKIFLRKNRYKYAQMMICFEDKNQIKGRIDMIKNFKKGSYKISRMAALGCLVCTVVTLTNALQVNALDINNLTKLENNIVYNNDKHEFLIDSDSKHYADMNKVQKVAGFKYKLPDYLVDNYEAVSGGSVQKISDSENAVEVYFNNTDENAAAWSYEMIISKCDAGDAVKKIQMDHSVGLSEDISANVEKKDASINGLNGQIMTVIIDTPEQSDGEYTFSATKETCRYFVWNEDGVNYSINYNSTFESNNKTRTIVDISDDNVYHIINSLKDIDNLTNVKYSKEQELSTETAVMAIFDEEDLQKAKNIIGFNPKFPVNINDDIKISQASINITGDSDIESNKLYYDMWMRYELEDGFITLTSAQKNEEYNQIKEKGYFDTEEFDIEKQESIPLKINAEKINLGNREVYQCREENKDNDLILHDYFWEEDGICYQLIIWNKSEESVDAIAEIFINSQEYK